MPVFDSMDYWLDTCPRRGAENMAVDQLLMERAGERPVLRVYHWSEPTVTFGYFLALADARRAFPSNKDCPLTYVRRWTGGGIVDHRIDLTYTLVVPRSHPLSRARGAESYREIHRALAETLEQLGEHVRLTAIDEGGGALACFANPVAYDLTDATGAKVAGAGQRRCRYGLLHQGSVITRADDVTFGSRLAAGLAGDVSDWQPDAAFFADARELADVRYGTREWLGKK